MDLSTRQGRREQGLLIQKVVERAGLSVEELANRIGCSRALIYQYLSGTTLAQPDRLQQIASVTGVSLAYFYSGELQDTKRGRRGASEDVSARFAERIQQLEELAGAQESPPDWAALASTCERILGLAPQAYDRAAEARALLRLGKARIRMGEFTRAVDGLSRAVEAFANLGDERSEFNSRQALGNALAATGRVTEAREEFKRVAQSGRWEARWSGAVSLAALDEQAGDYRSATARCDEAAAILEEGTDEREIARGMLYVNANRVNLYLACGDFTGAAPIAEKCLQDAEAVGDSGQHLEARLNLSVCALYQGRWAQSHHTLSSALPIALFVGDRSREMLIRAALAMVLAAIGDYDTATAQAKDALASALAQGDHRAELYAQMALADSYAGAHRNSEARYHANQALAVATALRLQLYQAECRLRLARLSLNSYDAEEAIDHIERALAQAEEIGARHVAVQGLILRSDWKLRHNEFEVADSDMRSALQHVGELKLIPLQWEAEALHSRIACAYDPPHNEEAELAAEKAVELIEGVRAELRDAGIPDTVLENRERQQIYLERAKLMVDRDDLEAANAFIQQAGWPPLAARFNPAAK